ncbi:MAG TPA: hypothetical protein VK890_05465 [Bacteroidia bacterium]|jgi:hypothetical protein|nr:hypothetical protein [Bacteroidia bacterium]
MKTLKTFLAVLIIALVSSNSFAQGGLLGKAKEAAAKKKDAAKETKGKGGKGNTDMAIKGTGTPKNAATTAPVKTPAPAATNK